MFRGEFVGDLAGAVGGIVIDHQQVHRPGQPENAFGQRDNIVALIVGRNDD